MSQVVAAPEALPQPITIPVREWAPWAIFAGVFLVFLVYLVCADQGATSLIGGHLVHEWMHDARHLLGFPCH